MKNTPRHQRGALEQNSDSTTRRVAVSVADRSSLPCPFSDRCTRLQYLGNETARCLFCYQILDRPDLLELFCGVPR